MVMHGATNPRAERRHSPPRNQPKKPAQLQEGDVTNLYGWVDVYRVGYGVLCRTQDYGQGRHKQKTSEDVHETAAAAR